MHRGVQRRADACRGLPRRAEACRGLKLVRVGQIVLELHAHASSRKTLVGVRGGKEGPPRLTDVKQYGTTCALSTMNNLLVTQKLRRGDGPIAYPQSRRAERLFGEVGRTKRASTHIKLEKLECNYDVRQDTCIKAFVRQMADAARLTVEEAAASEL